MSHLEKRKTRLVIRTGDTVRERKKERDVVLEFDSPYFCNVRLQGLRQRYSISYAAIYDLAVKKEVERQRAERKERRKKKA